MYVVLVHRVQALRATGKSKFTFIVWDGQAGAPLRPYAPAAGKLAAEMAMIRASRRAMRDRTECRRELKAGILIIPRAASHGTDLQWHRLANQRLDRGKLPLMGMSSPRQK